MSKVIDTGGESVVIINPRNEDEVIKIVPMGVDYQFYEKETDLNVFLYDKEKMYESERPRELSAKDLLHPNIIRFKGSSFQLINTVSTTATPDEKLFHFTT